MENIDEQFRQVTALIEILKDADNLCQGAPTAGLVASALEGAETLQLLMAEGTWPGSPEDLQFGASGLLQHPAEAFPAEDVAELCFPV